MTVIRVSRWMGQALVGASIVMATAAGAQGTCKVLHSFKGGEGDDPISALVVGSDGKLHGTAYLGGEHDSGTAFRMPTGGRLSVLHHFDGATGALPQGQIQARDGNYYGTADQGGEFGEGVIYRMTSHGKVTVLHSFNHQTDSAGVSGNPLVEAADGHFYGMTYGYWPFEFDAGAIFVMSPDGALTVLHRFTANGAEGANPEGGLIQASDGNFYGTTSLGGSAGLGTVFTMDATGVFKVLHSFQAGEGANPQGALVEGPDGLLYGTTAATVAPLNQGMVFRISRDGALSVLHRFTGIDGAHPIGRLLLGRDGAFYGVTWSGGPDDRGTVYRITRHGKFSMLQAFGASSPCAAGYPSAGLVEAGDGEFYGVSASGGDFDLGTVFRIQLGAPPFTSE